MKITIITSTFNSSDTIADCIASVNCQSYHDIEHIIVDGGSTDQTTGIAEATAERSPRVISEHDRGAYDAMNKGIRMAGGDIIGFLHADDTFADAQTLQYIADSFLSPSVVNDGNKHTDVVYGDLIFTDKEDSEKIIRRWVSRAFKPNLLKWGWMPPHPTVFMRREVYKKHGLFNINLKCAADYDYILRVFKDQALVFCYLPKVITRMRMGGISTKGIKNIINKKKEDYWVLKNNKMPFPLWILFAKNVTKIPQVIFRKG